MRDLKSYGHRYWRSLEHRAMSHDDEADAWKEFQAGLSPEATKTSLLRKPKRPEELTSKEHASLSRRNFMGASAALAGAAATTGCIRKPVEKIIPYSTRPEDTIPGEPLYFASVVATGSTVQGLLVESQDGRPTKIEGNPRHSGSQGATDSFVQATVLELYDPDRTRAPLSGSGEEVTALEWAAVREQLGALMAAKAETAVGGKGLALVVDQSLSPAIRQQLSIFGARFPQAKVFSNDVTAPTNAIAAAELIGDEGARVYHSLVGTHVVFAADSDFLTTETDHVRLSKEWAKTRRVAKTTDFMSRLYVAEAALTNTGVMADHRVRAKSADIGGMLTALAKELAALGIEWPNGAESVLGALPAPKLSETQTTFIKAIAKDLADQGSKGKSAVLVGERQPAWVHAVGYLINAGLKNVGTSVRWSFDSDAIKAAPVAELSKALDGGIDTVVCLGVNPAYDGSGDLGLADKLAKVNTIHLGLYRNETGKIAKTHVPLSHYLEAWGDLRAADGNVSIQQPLIAPLHDTYSALEWLAFFASGKMYEGSKLLQDHYESLVTSATWSERSWRRWLHDGIVTGIPREPVLPQQTGWGKIPDAAKASAQAGGAMEINLYLSPQVLDGRHGNNAWLQELPHPTTKMTWDNAALVSKATADKLGVGNGDLVKVDGPSGSITIAAFVAPGHADDTVSIALGYGHDWGSVGKDVGVNAYPLRTVASPWFFGGSVSAAGGKHQLVTTQDHGTMKPHTLMGIEYPERPIALEATRKEWEKRPGFVEDVNLMETKRLHHLWEPPKFTGKQQWGMSVDMNTCTGCNACVVACQAENNIPVVGKEQVSHGREMHWMRIDRYFRGSEDEPTAVVQPMMCQHCEAAPCETVCPVAATVHSPEGLNDMAYNRCVGTRYCSNNCPYKVRRFNFFHYNLDVRPGWNDDDLDGSYLRQMQKNPDVTVRFRGVMEKCTYCVQRINQAKIAAHVAGKDKVADKAIVVACQQVCPTDAIAFGDIADPDSEVSRAKANSRDYQVLRDLNNTPRTSYLARIRNNNPALGEMTLIHEVGQVEEHGAGEHGGGHDDHGAEGKEAH